MHGLTDTKLAEQGRSRANRGRIEAAESSGRPGRAALTMTPLEERGAPVDRTQAGGSVGLVLLVALALVGLAVFLLYIGREKAEPFIIAALAILSVVGVFALFASAAGIIEFTGRKARNDFTRALADGAGEGIALVDSAGRVIYANQSYLDLTGAENPDEVRPVERLFTSDPGVADVIYRLAQAAREGQALSEEIRIAGKGGQPSRWLRLRASRSGASPMSRVNATNRKIFSSNCSTPSIFSIMRRPDFSPPRAMAASSISTRRSRIGWVTISLSSDLKACISRKSSTLRRRR
jgi:PAS domain-containing protein